MRIIAFGYVPCQKKYMQKSTCRKVCKKKQMWKTAREKKCMRKSAQKCMRKIKHADFKLYQKLKFKVDT